MTEQEINDKFEQMCGGPDRAFRMMYIYRDAKMSARGSNFWGKNPPVSKIFKAKAKREHFSDKQIDFYLKYLT